MTTWSRQAWSRQAWSRHGAGILTPWTLRQIWRAMRMNAVITEERSVVIEIDATSCVTETADTTDKNQTAMPLVGGEQKPMMNV